MTPTYRIEDYLADVGRCRNNTFGQRFRNQFRDNRGSAELAMLASPNEQEYRDFCETVNVLTADEKNSIERLTDDEVSEIACRAKADQGNVSIFLNGYTLEKKNRNLNRPKPG